MTVAERTPPSTAFTQASILGIIPASRLGIISRTSSVVICVMIDSSSG